MKKKVLSLDELLYRPVKELKINFRGEVRTIKVRDPTEGEVREAMEAAKKHPLWESMKEEERLAEIVTQIALRMLVEPRITTENIHEISDIELREILDTVIVYRTMRLKSLTGKKADVEIQRFLEQEKDKSL